MTLSHFPSPSPEQLHVFLSRKVAWGLVCEVDDKASGDDGEAFMY